MAKLPSVSVVMPVRNEEKYLADSIRSIIEQNYQGDLEVILAIGPSVDKTWDVARAQQKRFPNLVLIENPKGLTTAGLNQAIHASSGEVVVRVDAHAALSAGYIEAAVATLKRSGAVLVGGVMNAVGNTPFQRAVAFGYRSRIGLGGGRYHVGGEEGEAESAYLGVFDAAALKSVGGYDEKIIRGEDWELAQRLKAAGGLVWFDPNLVVDYYPRASVRALSWQFFSTGIWRGELTRRAPAKASIRYFIPPLALLGLLDLIVLTSVGAANIAWLIIPIAFYLGLIAFFAATAKGLLLPDRLAALIALPLMHFSWAAGFWVGLVFGARQVVDSGERR